HEFEDTPFDKLVEELQPDRDPAVSPIFQVVFNHRSITGPDDPAPEGAAAPPVVPRTGTAKFDFSLSLLERAHGILAEVEIKQDLFEVETAARFLEHYQRRLRELLRDPQRPVREIDLLSAEERVATHAYPGPAVSEAATSALPHTARHTPPPPAGERVAPPPYPGPAVSEAATSALLEHARRDPDRIAVRSGATGLSYAELVARSDTWHAALQAAGHTRGAPVGVSLPAAVDRLIGLLAVVRAGGVGVPLSPFEPAPRLRA